MFNLDEEWNISFAGCGFRSIYYLGALSCILERVPQLVHGASKICGASSGCLVAAALTVGIPIEQFCSDILVIAKEARKHPLGVFHPTFSLLQTVRDSLLERLPEDAHLRASGKLCVSLTRLADGKNVLVSQFDSREELIQVLMCSCFFPIYCGFTPPSYRGVLYMDGALSNNLPLYEQRSTITMAPFSGENDICPREGPFNFLIVHYANVSVQICTNNVHRVCTSFLPPSPEMIGPWYLTQTLADICHCGYMDALRFLRENGLVEVQDLALNLVEETETMLPTCCVLAKESSWAHKSIKTKLKRLRDIQKEHRWLDLKMVENLPLNIRKLLCVACREGQEGRWSRFRKLLPVQVVLCLLTPLTVSIELTLSLIKSMISSGLAALRNLMPLTTNICRYIWGSGTQNSVCAEQQSSIFSRSELGDNKNTEVLTLTAASNSEGLHRDNNGNLDPLFCDNSSTCKAMLKYRRKWTHRT